MLLARWGWQWDRLCPETPKEMQRCSKEVPGLRETAGRTTKCKRRGRSAHRGGRQQEGVKGGFNREMHT